MSREKIFRGRRCDNKEWVEGFYVCLNGKEHRIYSGFAETDCGDYYPDFYTVDPETVGQLVSGIPDKNGKMIFEGDIVLWCGIKGIVVWEGHKFVIKGNLLWDFSDDDCIEVIGNIYDSPELIGGKNDEAN